MATPLVLLDYGAEWLHHWLDQMELFSVLGTLARLTIVVGIVGWWGGREDRAAAQQDARKSRQYQAWQVIATAQGRSNDFGRSLALTDLARDTVPLTDVDLGGAALADVDLRGADLRGANFSGARLTRVDFTGANLRGADLTQATLVDVSIHDMPDWAPAIDGSVWINSVVKTGLNAATQMDNVSFTGSDLSGEWWQGVWKKSWFRNTSLRNSHLSRVLLDSTYFYGADLRGAVVSPDGFVARFQGDESNLWGMLVQLTPDSLSDREYVDLVEEAEQQLVDLVSYRDGDINLCVPDWPDGSAAAVDPFPIEVAQHQLFGDAIRDTNAIACQCDWRYQVGRRFAAGLGLTGEERAAEGRAEEPGVARHLSSRFHVMESEFGNTWIRATCDRYSQWGVETLGRWLVIRDSVLAEPR